MYILKHKDNSLKIRHYREVLKDLEYDCEFNEIQISDYDLIETLEDIITTSTGDIYTESDFEIIKKSKEYKDKLAKQERERLAMLNMTGADVERAIYKVKGIDFDDILAMAKDNPAIDEKALKIEFKANNFYRGNPYIEQVGALLGFTSEQLDKFFETKDYIYLTACELTINAVPAEATGTGTVSYPYGTLVDYKVELEGYKPYTGSIALLKDTELNIELEKIEEVVDENTTDTTESDVQDELDTTTSKSDEIDTDILE